MPPTAFLPLLGAAAGFGLVFMAVGARHSGPLQQAGMAPRRQELLDRLESPSTLAALGTGLIAFLVTRWPVACLLGAGGALGLKSLGNAGAAKSVAELEAVATWTEMLRDTLAGASGLSQALLATAEMAPPALFGPVAALASNLTRGASVEASLRQLAEDISSPTTDMVVASLILANRERAQKLGDLLTALAASVREEVAMWLRIDASRASSRTAMRMVAGFSMALFALMSLFARSYLTPYRGETGQLILCLVGALFGLGLWLMAAMVRPEPLPRLFAKGGSEQ